MDPGHAGAARSGVPGRVTAVIPAYNAERYLGDAIRSVLTQSVAVGECLVVDDGSVDGTAEVARSFGSEVQLIERPNGGVSAARNTGIRAASCELIAFLDADDVWMPEKIERQLAVVDEGADLVYGGLLHVDEDLRPLVERPAAPPARAVTSVLLLEPSAPAVAQTVLVRTDLARTVGFDEDLSTSADADFLCRAAARGTVGAVPGPVALYRHHGAQMHANLDAFRHDMPIVIERALANPHVARGLPARRVWAAYHLALAFAHRVRPGGTAAAARELLAAATRSPGFVAGRLAGKAFEVRRRR